MHTQDCFLGTGFQSGRSPSWCTIVSVSHYLINPKNLAEVVCAFWGTSYSCLPKTLHDMLQLLFLHLYPFIVCDQTWGGVYLSWRVVMQSHRALSTGKGSSGKRKAASVCREGCWNGKLFDLGSWGRDWRSKELLDNPLPGYQGGLCYCKDRCYFRRILLVRQKVSVRLRGWNTDGRRGFLLCVRSCQEESSSIQTRDWISAQGIAHPV